MSTRTLALLGAALLTVGLLPTASRAQQVNTQTSFLSKVGPVGADDGFPTYYQDSNGLRLAHCFDGSALCGGAESPLPDPSQPVSFPDNYPYESFYFLAQAVIDLPSGGRAKYVASIEASFNSADPEAGTQMTFSRVRFVVDAPTTGTYTIIHPYGVDTFNVTSTGPHAIFATGDVGIASGVFTGALQGRIDPFLTWDTGLITDPQGNQYIGDPNTNHTVTGSPYGTNFFEIQAPNIGGPGVNSISTNLFALVGKIATNSGVDPGHPTYSRTDTTGGFVDVQASSDPGKAIRAALDGQTVTSLRGGPDGSYVARLPFTGSVPPTSVMVENVSDNPPAVFHPQVTDLVTITDATYDSDAQTLTVTAASSDQATPPPLNVTGFGALNPGTQTLDPAIPDGVTGAGTTGSATSASSTEVAMPALVGTVRVGTATFTGVAAPPETITVTSAAGGSATSRVTDVGSAFPADPVTADAGPDQTVQQGQTVTLDGSNSINATAFAWVQTGGPAVTLTGADSAVATFTAPNTATTLTFELITRNSTGTATDTVVITVAGVTAPVANAGPDQTGVLVGNPVVLDGTASTGAATFAWTQTAGTPATLTGADTARPTFIMPASSTPLVFQLTVTGPGGSATDSVSITAMPDFLAITRAQYTISKSEWRIDGTTSILDNNTISVFLGNGTSGPLIGSAQASPVDGTFDVRIRDSAVLPGGNTTVTVQSSRGGLLIGVPFQTQN